MGKFKFMFILGVVVIVIVVVAINILIRQSEKEIVSNAASQAKITVKQEVTVSKEGKGVRARKVEEPAPRIIPPGEVRDN